MSRAQTDARIRVLCWKKNICMAAGGGQDCDGTVSQQLQQDESTQPDVFTLNCLKTSPGKGEAHYKLKVHIDKDSLMQSTLNLNGGG